MIKRKSFLWLVAVTVVATITVAQTRRRVPPSSQSQAPRGSAARYSAFLHASEKHKSLACNGCHKIPTAWNAKREFPDVADFPDHDACVRCHRQQFFTAQAFSGTGPTICTVCHLRAAPREEARFAFGKPNGGKQTAKPKDERQFTIEFPHDKHQNVIAWGGKRRPSLPASLELHHRSQPAVDDKKPDYNNCTLCHQRNDELLIVPLPPNPRASIDVGKSISPPAPTDASNLGNKFYKTLPHSHDACFDCHWKNQKPASDDCAGCHKPTNTFVASLAPKRISEKFSHEGGKGEHVMECTTCHINITRASTLRGLTPDVPIAACTSCHKDNKKTTYPKAVTIEEEFAQYKKTNTCSYCHTPEVGTKKPPPSHDAAAQ